MVINTNLAAEIGAKVLADSSARVSRSVARLSSSAKLTTQDQADRPSLPPRTADPERNHINDVDEANESTTYAEVNIAQHPMLAMLAQANVGREAAFRLLSS